jgi:hypothetical protein
MERSRGGSHLIVVLLLLILLVITRRRIVEYADDPTKMVRLLYEFYYGYPLYGFYVQILNKINTIVRKILVKYCTTPGRTIVFDFDDTLVYTRPHLMILNHSSGTQTKVYPGIPQIIDLAKYAKSLGYFVAVVSAREETMRETTLQNIAFLGIEVDHLCLLGPTSAKQNVYKQLETQRINEINPIKFPNNTNVCRLILILGDNWYDIATVHTKRITSVKLPHPHDMNAYICRGKKIQTL